MRTKKTIRGFGILEIVVAIGIITGSLFGIMSAAGLAFRLTSETTKNIQAAYLLEEGFEALRILRDESFEYNITVFNPDTAYYLYFDNNRFYATTTSFLIDNFFERSFTVQNVYRDLSEDIVLSGGVLDPDTKKITVSVSWPSRKGTSTKSITGYLTNLFGN